MIKRQRHYYRVRSGQKSKLESISKITTIRLVTVYCCSSITTTTKENLMIPREAEVVCVTIKIKITFLLTSDYANRGQNLAFEE